MNWVDLTILGVIAISAAIGWLRGFLREVLSIGAWIAAAWIAADWYERVAGMIAPYLPSADIAAPAAFGAVFLAALILLSIAAAVISRLARISALSPLDSTLGIVFGIVRGALVVVVAYITGAMLLPVDRWPPPVQNARLLPYIYRGATTLVALAPREYRPAVAAPAAPETALPATPPPVDLLAPAGK
jgi:membrane protein required for colicin V production